MIWKSCFEKTVASNLSERWEKHILIELILKTKLISFAIQIARLSGAVADMRHSGIQIRCCGRNALIRSGAVEIGRSALRDHSVALQETIFDYKLFIRDFFWLMKDFLAILHHRFILIYLIIYSFILFHSHNNAFILSRLWFIHLDYTLTTLQNYTLRLSFLKSNLKVDEWINLVDS